MPIPDFLYGKELTEEQKQIVHATGTHKVIFIDAIAGSGKTWLATAIAKQLNKKMHYIFSPMEQDLGLLPGTLKEKMYPFLLPLHDALVGINEIPEMAMNEEFGWVVPSPHTYWRGGNLEDSVIVIDEAQNFTTHQLKKLLTRIHDSCLVFVIGHNLQVDLKNPKKSGFQPYIDAIPGYSKATLCYLTRNFRGELSRWADNVGSERYESAERQIS